MYRASSYSTTPEVAKKIALGILNKDDSTKSSYYYNFTQDNPNVEPNDAVVADYIVKQGEARRPSNPYTFQDKFKPVSEGKKTGGAGGLTKAEQKTLLEEEDRKRNVRNLIDNKSQDVFELIKASLPAGSSMSWLNVKDKITGKTKTAGIKIKTPTYRNKVGEIIGEKVQQIIFDKGNPYAAVNEILNTHTDKTVRGEKFLKEKKPNTQPKPSTGQSNQSVDNSKVLQGTKAQLKDAASKKGLSIDEYKKQLKLAGYTVIEK
jgi:hypothetical protein